MSFSVAPHCARCRQTVSPGTRAGSKRARSNSAWNDHELLRCDTIFAAYVPRGPFRIGDHRIAAHHHRIVEALERRARGVKAVIGGDERDPPPGARPRARSRPGPASAHGRALCSVYGSDRGCAAHSPTACRGFGIHGHRDPLAACRLAARPPCVRRADATSAAKPSRTSARSDFDRRALGAPCLERGHDLKDHWPDRSRRFSLAHRIPSSEAGANHAGFVTVYQSCDPVGCGPVGGRVRCARGENVSRSTIRHWGGGTAMTAASRLRSTMPRAPKRKLPAGPRRGAARLPCIARRSRLSDLKRYPEAAQKLEAAANQSAAAPSLRAELLDQAGNAWLLAGAAGKAESALGRGARARRLTSEDVLADRARERGAATELDGRDRRSDRRARARSRPRRYLRAARERDACAGAEERSPGRHRARARNLSGLSRSAGRTRHDAARSRRQIRRPRRLAASRKRSPPTAPPPPPCAHASRGWKGAASG